MKGGRPDTDKQGYRHWLPFALFAVLVCIFLWRPIFTGRALLPGDYLAQMKPWDSVIKLHGDPPQWNPLQWDAIAQFYPWRVFYARSLRSGHIPLWNPHQFCGTPFLANGQSAVFYPPNLLFVVLDPITAFTVLAALHLFLAMVFMYLLMRELGRSEIAGIIAAVVFAFSAFTVLWLELPTFVQTATWLPLALVLIHRSVERRSVFHGMLAGLVLAMSVLAGHFQIAFYVVMAAMLWWAWMLVEMRRSEGRIYTVLKVVVPFAACFAVLAAISAPQALSTVELAANSHRVRVAGPEGYSRFVANAVQPYRFVTAFAHNYFGSPASNNYYLLGMIDGHPSSAADYMEYGLYAGILPLLLALMGALAMRRLKYAGYFAVLAAIALLTAIGTPVNYVFYYLLPGFSALGGPNRILLLYFFGVAALAAYGCDMLLDHVSVRVFWRRKDRRLTWLYGLIALHIVIFSGFGWRMYAKSWLTVHDLLHKEISGPATWSYLALLVVSDLLFIIRARDGIGRRLFATLAVVLIGADLFAFGINYNPTCPRSFVYPKTKLTTQLQRLTKNGERIAPINPNWSLWQTPNAILPPNAAMVYGLYDIQGYDSLYTRAYKELSSRMQGEDSSPPENGNMVLMKRADHWDDTGLPSTPWPSLYGTADVLLSREPLTALEPWLESAGEANGVQIGRFRDVVTVRPPGGQPEFDLHVSRGKSPYRGPNRLVFDLPAGTADAASSMPRDLMLRFLRPDCPGWVARDEGDGRVPSSQFTDEGHGHTSQPVVHETARAVLSFEPFTFRLGLYLMLIGFSSIACVGVFRFLRYRWENR